MAYLVYCVLAIVACFLIGAIVNVIEAKISKETLGGNDLWMKKIKKS